MVRCWGFGIHWRRNVALVDDCLFEMNSKLWADCNIEVFLSATTMQINMASWHQTSRCSRGPIPDPIISKREFFSPKTWSKFPIYVFIVGALYFFHILLFKMHAWQMARINHIIISRYRYPTKLNDIISKANLTAIQIPLLGNHSLPFCVLPLDCSLWVSPVMRRPSSGLARGLARRGH